MLVTSAMSTSPEASLSYRMNTALSAAPAESPAAAASALLPRVGRRRRSGCMWHSHAGFLQHGGSGTRSSMRRRPPCAARVRRSRDMCAAKARNGMTPVLNGSTAARVAATRRGSAEASAMPAACSSTGRHAASANPSPSPSLPSSMANAATKHSRCAAVKPLSTCAGTWYSVSSSPDDAIFRSTRFVVRGDGGAVNAGPASTKSTSLASSSAADSRAARCRSNSATAAL